MPVWQSHRLQARRRLGCGEKIRGWGAYWLGVIDEVLGPLGK